MLQLFLIFLLGCGAGLLSGIFGIGGGLVIVPGLIYLFKYEPTSAVATSLGALLLPVGLLAVLQYNRHGLVNWKAVAALAVGILLCSWVSALIVTNLPSQNWLPKAFGLLLIMVGLRFFFKS